MRSGLASGLLGLALLAPSAPAAAAETVDETQRWVPSLAVFFDILGQKASGAVSTGAVLGPPLPGGCGGTSPNPGGLCPSARQDPAMLLADDTGHDTSITPMVGGSLELMTPSLLDAFLRPRLFVRGDATAAFAFERNLAGVESPGEFSSPVITGQAVSDIEELAVNGQGSRTRYQIRQWVFSAGAGVALSIDLFSRRLRIKPSVEYLHQEADLIGVAHRAVKLVQPAPPADGLGSFRLVSITRVEQEAYDGIGPGLEIEADTARLGPIGTSVYIMGRGVHLFGDLKTTFSQTNEFGEIATWTFEPDPWVWRAGVGIRFRWLPE